MTRCNFSAKQGHNLELLAQNLLHMAKYGNKPAPSEPTPKKKHRAAVAFEASSDDTEDIDTDAEMPGLEDSSSEERLKTLLLI